jgi:hypothetical protein
MKTFCQFSVDFEVGKQRTLAPYINLKSSIMKNLDLSNRFSRRLGRKGRKKPLPY